MSVEVDIAPLPDDRALATLLADGLTVCYV
jgi:hypothetical protein